MLWKKSAESLRLAYLVGNGMQRRTESLSIFECFFSWGDPSEKSKVPFSVLL